MYIPIPVAEFAAIAANKVATANARTRDIRLDNAKHGHGGWNRTARLWTRCGDNCETWSLDSVNIAAVRAVAEVANADADYALAMADAAEDAARIMRAADPLAYSSDVGYIS